MTLVRNRLISLSIIFMLLIYSYFYSVMQITLKNRIGEEPFNETNPYLSSWCPAAACPNSPVCSPCSQRFLFILATARSGSTTILQTLNTLPGVRLSGENDNVFYNLWKLTSGERMKHTLNQDYDQDTGPWMHNAIPRGAMSCTVQNFMKTINPPQLSIQKFSNALPLSTSDRSTIIGAKMIRIQRRKNDWSPFNVTKFIRKNFPCAKVVVSIRSDVQSELKSMNNTFFKHPVNFTIEDLLKQNEFLLSVAKLMGKDAARVIDITKWSDDISILNDLIEWIGFKNCILENIVRTNQGKSGFEQEKVGTSFGPTCRYPYL